MSKEYFIVIYQRSMRVVFLFFYAALTQAGTTGSVDKHPLYLGVLGGYGSTTWQGLVPNKKNQNAALNMSTPISVKEGGGTWGVLLGYEFSPYFAFEANYMHYPDSTIYFDESSIFTFDHDGALSLTTKTDSINLIGKIMLVVPHTNFRIYSGAGLANIYRKDILVDDWRSSPIFSLGINYNFTNHLMGELVGNYTTGFGESILSPADSYFPFLYSITAHLAYRL
jgi:hypothetical protein